MATLLIGSLISCNAQQKSNTGFIKGELADVSGHLPLGPLSGNPMGCCDSSYLTITDTSREIGEYVRRIFEDSRGHLWLGTNKYGVARYDGKTLNYYSIPEGLSGTQVTGIIEDWEGNIWFSTSGGVSRFNGQDFTSFTAKEGLSANNVWSIFQDSKGNIWAGTIHGLCRFNGEGFTPVDIPQRSHSGFNNAWIACITEDQQGNLWIGTRGNGACKYDGSTFSFLSKEDGLCDNDIVCILPDNEGRLWFSSMFGGISMYEGNAFTTYNAFNSIGNNEVWNMHEDHSGDIWFSSEGYGLYRFNGKAMSHYNADDGMPIGAVQSIFQDSEKDLWIGGGGGLYKYHDGTFTHITKEGPWEIL